MLAKSISGAAAAAAPAYIEDTFSTYLYTGNGSTQTITNGIDLSGKGGLVWTKDRNNGLSHALYDTVRGAGSELSTDTTAAASAENGFAFLSNGYSFGARSLLNFNGGLYASWTFRKQAKFFDVVTYTGNGANRTIAHNLGSVPGCIIVKRTDTSADWQVYHRSLASTQYLVLNDTAVNATGTTRWNSTTPTSTVFSLGTDTTVNASGGTYVAYLFAHDAGGFGLAGTDNVISCGSFNSSDSGTAVNLGYEPQFLLYKNITTASDWKIIDSTRGFCARTLSTDGGQNVTINTNTSAAEVSESNLIGLTSTGFNWFSGDLPASNSFIYIAIRRGPMKTPTSGASVFSPVVYTGTNVDNRLVNTSLFTDFVIARERDSTTRSGMVIGDRLRSAGTAGGVLFTGSTGGEQNLADGFMPPVAAPGTAFSSMDGFGCGNNLTARLNVSTTSNNQVAEAFRRAPGFFDAVTYAGTGSARTVTHNLGAQPELMIVKRRTVTNATGWAVYANNDNTDYLMLNTNAATADSIQYWNNTSPTSSVFTVGINDAVNASSVSYVAYLFASLANVSKVGSYTGTGTTKQIDCAFTGGARFVLIKRTDSTGDWYVWDTARGIVAGNDPYLLLNSTAAEVTSTDYIDTYSAGFEISSTAPADINANGGTFIFLAIA